MIELKRHVETIVRPIRGFVPRKNKMREELLGHLLGIFDEEMAHCGNPDQAVAAAKHRLGDVAALRKELQASVPPLERRAMTPIPALRTLSRWIEAGASSWQYAGRIAGLATLACFLLLSLIFVAETLTGRYTPEKLALEVFAFPISQGMAIFLSAYAFRASGAHAKCIGASETSPFLKSCMVNALLVFFLGVFLTFSLTSLRIFDPARYTVALLAISCKEIKHSFLLFLLLNPLLSTFSLSFNRRQYVEWGCLDIEDD